MSGEWIPGELFIQMWSCLIQSNLEVTVQGQANKYDYISTNAYNKDVSKLIWLQIWKHLKCESGEDQKKCLVQFGTYDSTHISTRKSGLFFYIALVHDTPGQRKIEKIEFVLLFLVYKATDSSYFSVGSPSRPHVNWMKPPKSLQEIHQRT